MAIPWYRSGFALVAASLLFPPLGLILLWLRGGTGLGARVMGTLAIGAVAVAHLFLFYGLRVELDGTGSRPIFSFTGRGGRDAMVERSRAEQQAAPAPAESQTAPPAAPPAAAPEVVQAQEKQHQSYWADFRGPGRTGIYDQTPILTTWPKEGLKLLWHQPVGGGYASFVIADGVAFTIEQRRKQEVAAAYDVKTGKEKWTSMWNADFRESMGGDGPRATPVWDEGRVYVQGAEGELRALDAATGKTIWAKNVNTENGTGNLQWGMSNSPLVVGGKLIVTTGGGGGKSVVAYEKTTGKPIWKAHDDKQAYTSPMLVTLAGRRQVLVVSAKRAMGIDPDDGALLWDYPWTTEYDINSAQPIVTGPNRFFLSAGYGHGAALVEVAADGPRFKTRTVWQNTKMKNKFNSSVLHEGHIYGMDEAILACINAETGEQKWKGGRYGYGQLILAQGHLVVLTEAGELVLVKASPDRHAELARFPAIEGKTWNHPAISDGYLLVRNTSEMACFRIAPQAK